MKTHARAIRESWRPRPKGSSRPPERSKRVDFVPLTADSQTLGGTEGSLHSVKTPWEEEPVLDHAADTT